jgi:predicted DNA-binding WGR domain protein
MRAAWGQADTRPRASPLHCWPMRIFMQATPAPGSPPRFYQLILAPDLLGGFILTRNWGEQGKRGSLKEEHYPDLASAQSALMRWRDQQLKGGFKVMFAQGAEHAA